MFKITSKPISFKSPIDLGKHMTKKKQTLRWFEIYGDICRNIASKVILNMYWDSERPVNSNFYSSSIISKLFPLLPAKTIYLRWCLQKLFQASYSQILVLNWTTGIVNLQIVSIECSPSWEALYWEMGALLGFS